MRKRLTKAFAAVSALAMALMQMTFLPPAGAASADVPDFSSLGAVGTLSKKQTTEVAGSIYESLAAHEDFADFSERVSEPIAPTPENFDSLMKVFVTVIGGWDVGILANKSDSNCVVRHTSENGGFVLGMAIYYWEGSDTYDATYADLMTQLDTITAGVDPAWSAPEKALYLHEYMAVHFDYDFDALYTTEMTEDKKLSYTAYGLLKKGKSVCDGYTWLYNILLRRVGVESLAVTSLTLNHSWNMLYIDGKWYHVDVTWDDYDDGHPGLVRHDSFLKNRILMKSSGHTSSDWTLSTGKPESELSESSKYNYAFWDEADSVVQPYQGKWFAVIPDSKSPTTGWFNLYSFDASTGESECTTIASQSQSWYVWGNSSHYYSANYIIPSENCGTIYYTTPSSIMALQNGRHVWVCNLTPEQAQLGYIYGMRTEGDTLWYSVSQSPKDETEEFSIDLREYRDRIYAEAGAVGEEPPASSETTASTEPIQTDAPASTEAVQTTTSTETSTESTAETTSDPLLTASDETTTVTEETTTEETTTTPDLPPGDADGDGALSILDFIAMYRYLTGTLPIESVRVDHLDLYEDGVIDIFDLTMLKRLLLAETTETANNT